MSQVCDFLTIWLIVEKIVGSAQNLDCGISAGGDGFQVAMTGYNFEIFTPEPQL
jgi:hypothetical protein